jgi:hypothetical protein
MNEITHVVINGTQYPFVKNTNAFDTFSICYEKDGNTIKTSITNVEEFITD